MRYLFDNCVLDTDRRELSRAGEAVSVAPQVFDVLAYLVRNRERVVSKDDLIAEVWDGRIVSDSALTTRLNVARSAIGDNGEEQRLIKTLMRKGFRFVGAVREQSAIVAAENAQASVEAKPALTLPDRPSIAVLAFSNLGGDTEQEYFADGLVEDIITALSRFRGCSSSRASLRSPTRARLSTSSRLAANSACAMCSKAACARLVSA